MSPPLRIVVTGGAGFIGGNLCRALAADGHDVVAFDDLSTGLAANLDGTGVALVEGSILDRTVLECSVAKADAVVHLAARGSVPRSLAEPLATHEVNAGGTAEVLEACRLAGVRHVLLSSSSSVYGANATLPKHEELLPAPMSPYAASKLAAESLTFAYQRSYGLPVLVFRFFNVFGPLQLASHDYAAVVPRFLDAAVNGRVAEVHGDGEQSRDFTYVGSVVRVLCDALARRVLHPSPVNLAFGTRTTLNEVLEEIGELVGHPVERRHVDPRPGDVRESQADVRLLHALFPDVQPVPLREGLSQTLRWARG